jgi:NAD(P)-dependent dehydrogenase (short-subunit alcohol dehydrogenase family)
VGLRGKRVLITGASRGIDESLARAFAEAGAGISK